MEAIAKQQEKPTEIKTVEQIYKITVNRREDDYHPLPKQLRDSSYYKGNISSQYKVINGYTTTAIIRGLDTNQERFYSSQLINKNPKDLGFDDVMTTFWAEFTLAVPEGGLILDASYTEEKVKLDGEEIFIKKPKYLDQYIKAEFAKQSNGVAFLPEERDNPDLFKFIMNDLSVAKAESRKKFDQISIADAKYVELVTLVKETGKTEKVEYMLDLLKEDHELFYNVDLTDKLMRLKEIANQKPVEFVTKYNDDLLEVKALLYRLTQTRLITLEGGTYFLDNKQIGAYKEAITYLNDQTNSGEVSKLKARLKDILLKK